MRELDATEKLYLSDPRALARYHYCLTGENHNPYEKASVESLEYLSQFQQLYLQEDLSC